MDARELLDRINGTDEEGEARAIIGVHLYVMDADGNVKKELAECSMHGPVIRLGGTDMGFAVMDIDFDTDADSMLTKMHTLFMRYAAEKTREVTDPDDPSFICLMICLIPADEEHDGYIMAYNPLMHVLCASDVRRPVSCIRLLLKDETVNLYETESELDFTSVETSVRMQINQREEILRKEEERRQKRREDMEHLNELMKKSR